MLFMCICQTFIKEFTYLLLLPIRTTCFNIYLLVWVSLSAHCNMYLLLGDTCLVAKSPIPLVSIDNRVTNDDDMYGMVMKFNAMNDFFKYITYI